MRISLIKKKREKKLHHKVKILLISVLFRQILFNIPIYSLYTPPFMTPLARMKGFSGNNLGDGPSSSSDDDYADDNSDSTVNEVKSRLAIENLSFTEESGDSEPDDGEELLSEKWSDISSADSYDKDFIDSSDDINDLSSDDNISTTNQLTRKRLFTARHQSSTSSDCLESLHHESSFSDSNVSSDEILSTYDEVSPVITPVKKTRLRTPEKRQLQTNTQALYRQNSTTDERRRLQKMMSARNNRVTETPENAGRRRDQDRDRARTSRATETPDNAERRRDQDRDRARNNRVTETPENARRRQDQDRDRVRNNRVTETPENAARRREQDRVRVRNLRDAETPEEAEYRLLQARNRRLLIAPEHVQDHINGTFILFVLLYN